VHLQRPLKVIIIGAGIGGLAAACSLRQRGIEADVYESAGAIAEVGAGLQLGPNAVKVLEALGFSDALLDCTFEPLNRVTLNWNDATVRHSTPIKRDYPVLYGARFKTVHRADLHRLLLESLPDGTVHLGKTCVDVETRGEVAVARFADGLEVEADLVIGADGIRSTVRRILFGFDQPRFTKSIAWRCLIDIAHVPEVVGPGGSVALDRRDHISWYGPDGQVLCYPIADGSVWNIYAGRRSDEWAEESWSAPSSKEALIEAYRGWNEALLGVFEKVEEVYKWGIFDRDPMPEWTRGSITLLGDAAHPTMPNLAQGANMAIEDGYVLSRNLAGDGVLTARLDRYVRERQPRTSQITLQSRENFENSMAIPPLPPLDRGWIFGFDATQEPGDEASAGSPKSRPDVAS
jgi:salicylate hydroxylase